MKGKALDERLWRVVPGAARPPARLAARSVQLWFASGGPQYGAAIAFYTMFALAPLLVLAIWLAGFFFGEEAARGHIVAQIESLVGTTAARGIEALVESAWREPVGNLAGVLAIGTLLLGASGVFAQLRHALNAMGQIREVPSPVGAYLRARLVAFALVLGFGFLSIATLLASATLAALGKWLSLSFPAAAGLLALADVAVSAIVITLGFAALLRWLPDRPASRRAVWTGAVTGALMFALGKHLIGLYLGRASVASSYGAAGSFVVVMMWMYYSAQILLFGASLGRAIDERRGLAPGRGREIGAGAWGAAGVTAPGAAPLPERRDPEVGAGGVGAEVGGDVEPHASGGPAQPASPPPSSGAKVLPFSAALRSRRNAR